MDVGLSGHLFGLPCSWEAAHWVLVPVPWAVTASYRSGAERAPAAVLEASAQVDTALFDIIAPWEAGVHMLPVPEQVLQRHATLRPKVEAYLCKLALGSSSADHKALCEAVNVQTEGLCTWVREQVEAILAARKCPALLGGEHSVTQGAVQALLRHYPSLGVLQIDAHMDLRPAYTGFRHSHASVMYNLLENDGLERLIQVGIREFSAHERTYAEQKGSKICTFYADALHDARSEGHSWKDLMDEIIATLPDQLYISLDMDALEPVYCPRVGTPAAGGLSFADLVYFVRRLASRKQIIGFDLVETVPDEASVGQTVAAQLLYRLFAYATHSERAAGR